MQVQFNLLQFLFNTWLFNSYLDVFYYNNYSAFNIVQHVLVSNEHNALANLHYQLECLYQHLVYLHLISI